MVRSLKALAAALLVAFSLVSLAGCAPGGSGLDGTRWQLDVWTISSVGPRDVPITARFDGGLVSGTIGASAYSGSYKAGPGAAFSSGPIRVTRSAGSELATRAETAYLALLGQAKSFKMRDAKLTFYDEFGNESLTFEAATR